MQTASALRSPLLLLTIAIALALVLPVLMMDGMFMDGMMYTAVGHNLAIGKGTFWYPYYQDNFHYLDSYHENPPLGYFLVSIFFRVFGSSIFVERFYILFTFVLTGFLIYKLWSQLFPKHKSISWLPVLFWAIIPTVFWSYTHNMMENTMVIFILLAIMGQVRAMRQKNTWLWLGVAGSLIILGFLVKGITALFPLAGIFIYWLLWRPFSFVRMVLLSLFYAAFTLGIILLLFYLPHTELSMHNYFFERTFQRISTVPIVQNRLWIIGNWFQQLILPLLLVILALLLKRPRNFKFSLNADVRQFGFLFLLGLCGVLPLMLTKVQRPFYLVTVFPLFALALAVPVAGIIRAWQEKLSHKPRVKLGISLAAALIFGGTLAATIILAGQPKRSESTLADVKTIAKVVGKEGEISASIKVGNDESLRAYLVRLHQIQLHNAYNRGNHFEEYHLVLPGDDDIPEYYTKVPVELVNYDLYKKQSP